METGTGGALTVADKDCCTMAEISVWIPWITEAKNSGNITAQEVEPYVWRAITEVVMVDEKVGNDKVKDTQGGNELSKLFLVCRVEQRKEETKEWSKNSPYKWQTNKSSICMSQLKRIWRQTCIKQMAKSGKSNSKQTRRATLGGNETNVHAQGDHLLANRKSPSQRWILIISFFLQYVCKPEILGSNALFYVCSEKDLELLKYPALHFG